MTQPEASVLLFRGSVVEHTELFVDCPSPAEARQGAIAALQAELDAMLNGLTRPTPRELAELRVSIETLRACDDDHVESTLHAIFEVRHWGFS